MSWANRGSLGVGKNDQKIKRGVNEKQTEKGTQKTPKEKRSKQ